jgi:Uma2 family endonuclease
MFVGAWDMAGRISRERVVYGTPQRLPPPVIAGHAKLVNSFHEALLEYVAPRSLGSLWVNVDIVLDARGGIVLQPDISFISEGRESIVRDRVWGPPEMVLEITSPFTHSGDLEERVASFSLYGVHEYWLVQPQQKDIAILELAHGGVRRRTLIDDISPINSALFPDFDRCLGEFLI